MRHLKYFLPWMLILCLALALLPLSIASAQDVTVWVDAPAEVAAGSNFTVSVNVTEVTNFDSYQWKLTYDPTVIEVIGEEMGPAGVTDGVIDSIPVPVDMWAFSPLGEPGTIFVLGNLPGIAGVNGTGYLTEIHCRVVGSGCNTSTLTFSEGKLVNKWGENMTPVTWFGDSVHVYEALSVTCDATPNPTKVDHPVDFTATPSGGVPAYTYSWIFGDGGNSTQQNPSHAYSTAGNYSACVTVTDFLDNTSNPCCIDMTVSPPLSLTCDASPNPTKVGHPVDFTATPSGGVPGYTYSWTFGEGGNSTEQNPGYAYSSAGNYSACVSVTDFLDNTSNPCCIDMTVNTALDVTDCAANPNPARVGQNATFSANVTGGVAPHAYDWDFGDGSTHSNLPSPTHAYATGNTTYNVTITVTDDLSNVEDCSFDIFVCILGDANLDCVVNMGDVTEVERIILTLDPSTACADANQDGIINMADVTKIERIILGLD